MPVKNKYRERINSDGCKKYPCFEYSTRTDAPDEAAGRAGTGTTATAAQPRGLNEHVECALVYSTRAQLGVRKTKIQVTPRSPLSPMSAQRKRRERRTNSIFLLLIFLLKMGRSSTPAGGLICRKGQSGAVQVDFVAA